VKGVFRILLLLLAWRHHFLLRKEAKGGQIMTYLLEMGVELGERVILLLMMAPRVAQPWIMRLWLLSLHLVPRYLLNMTMNQ
jgi:hypothetical protein